jgi:transposase InsO family protein
VNPWAMGSPGDVHRGRRGIEVATRAERDDHRWSSHLVPPPPERRGPTRATPCANAAALHVHVRAGRVIGVEVDAPGGDG